MRILAVADLHNREDKVRLIESDIETHGVEALVIAGDITDYMNPEPFIHRLNQVPVPVFAVRGNADFPWVEKLLNSFQNICALHRRESRFKECRFVGLSGAIPIPFQARVALWERRLFDKTAPVVGEKTILVTHPPPHGAQDLAFGKFHSGSRGLRAFVLQTRPAMLLCGHVHEHVGTSMIGTTVVVNCSIGDSGRGALIDYDGINPPKVRML